MSEAVGNSDWRAVHGVIFFSLLVFTALLPELHRWPLFWAFPLVCYFLLTACTPPLRASFRPWYFGRVTPFTVTATVAITLVACGTLVSFQILRHPALGHLSSLLSPLVASGGVMLTGVAFSICNAFLEELAFRGVFYDAAESQFGTGFAIIATAALFGYGHVGGYPPGPLGAVLAGIYGLLLGWLRCFSNGLGLPLISHVAADATIFSILVWTGAL
ncbi:CPBP family intramembrane glutamic endopeptidase [Verrucomicrobiota bacterium sgz303538]